MARTSTLFTRACRGEPVERVPVWLMRQAGRYMQQYREVKDQAGGFFELCRNPELSAKATLDAAAYLDTDAAIIFSDITLPGWAMGLPLEFSPGPRFSRPVRSEADVAALKDVDPDAAMGFVMQAIRLTRAALPAPKSLIGFVGAPWTLAGYMVEGGPSRNYIELKRLAYGNGRLMQRLLDKVAEAVTRHAIAQVEAGCDAVQIFDTLAGELAETELFDLAYASAQKVIGGLKHLEVPIIYFARGIGAHLDKAAQLGADVLGLDWSVSVAAARRRVGSDTALMGNLDPGVLFTTPAEIEKRARDILEQARGHAFVFNLGHGVLVGTPPEHAKHLIDVVKAWRC